MRPRSNAASRDATPVECRLPHIYVDCGTEDGLIDAAKAFIQILLDNDIPFDFMQDHGPGRDRW